MKEIIAVLSLVLLVSCASSGDLYYTQLERGMSIPSTAGRLDHSAWDALLNTYVDADGFVDYKGFATQRDKLKGYLDYLGSNAPRPGTQVNEQFAYYINLYNAAIIHLMLENGIPNSIKDLGSTVSPVWNKSFIQVGGNSYALNDIEKAVLQKMGDPRIHFAINCASYSCPKLQNKAFTAENVEALMQQSAREFINSDKNALSDPTNPKLSSIFKWYRSDFTDGGMTLIEYVNQYADSKIDSTATVDYLDYDWSINSQQNKK